VANTSAQVFRKSLVLTSYLVLAIAIVGGALGFLVLGLQGLYSALLGAAVALGFSAITILSVWFGGKLPLNGFFGLVLGGWLLKVILFALSLGALRNAEFISGPAFFFALVAAILGGLAIDSYVVLKSRIPIIEN